MVSVTGASPTYERFIRESLAALPDWYFTAGGISSIEVTPRPEVRAQIAMYEHGSRRLYIAPNVGGILPRAVAHEIAHGIDDQPENLHFFSTSPEWVRIHQSQSQFEIPKYRDEALEYFADMMSKFIMIGPEKLAMTNPKEAQFMAGVVRYLQEKER